MEELAAAVAENQAKEAAAAPQQAPQQPAADLNISDLVAIKSILEVASQRGAFKAAELEAVGKTFNKLNNFLESVSKKEA
jgi:hypothetical protein